MTHVTIIFGILFTFSKHHLKLTWDERLYSIIIARALAVIAKA